MEAHEGERELTFSNDASHKARGGVPLEPSKAVCHIESHKRFWTVSKTNPERCSLRPCCTTVYSCVPSVALHDDVARTLNA